MVQIYHSKVKIRRSVRTVSFWDWEERINRSGMLRVEIVECKKQHGKLRNALLSNWLHNRIRNILKYYNYRKYWKNEFILCYFSHHFGYRSPSGIFYLWVVIRSSNVEYVHSNILMVLQREGMHSSVEHSNMRTVLREISLENRKLPHFNSIFLYFSLCTSNKITTFVDAGCIIQ